MEEIQKLLESGKCLLERTWSLPVNLHVLYSLGTIKPVTDSVFSFEDALQAYDKLISSKTTGKVIVKVDPTVQWVSDTWAQLWESFSAHIQNL